MCGVVEGEVDEVRSNGFDDDVMVMGARFEMKSLVVVKFEEKPNSAIIIRDS